MSRLQPILLLLAAGTVLGGPASAAEGRRNRAAAAAAAAAPASSLTPARTFDAFQLVVERNIFNPNRVGRTRVSSDEKPPRVDELSLVGTVQRGEERLALFDSPDAALRKTLHEGESVADFKVEKITSAGVELLRGDKPLSLKVAQQLRRTEGGDWSVAANQAARADPRALTASPAGASRPADPAAPVEIPADASEVLKRLMKQREKQLK